MDNNEYDENLNDYLNNKKKDISLPSILTSVELDYVKQILFSFVGSGWKKVAFIVGATFNQIKKDNQLPALIKRDDMDFLLHEYLISISKEYCFDIAGDIRAMRFSEIRKI